LITASLNVENSSSRKLPFHEAGVTMILPISLTNTSPEESELLLTGSYDDFIRVYQPPSLYNSKPKVLAQRDIGCRGGGVWRLKVLDDENMTRGAALQTGGGRSAVQRKLLVLASCMRVGCKILEIKESHEGEWTIDVLANTAVHDSMNYASDVVPFVDRANAANRVRTIVSTSFYDRLLFVWKWEPDIEIDEVLQ
jgi:diphthamide biosynthesis protein 7